MKVTSRDERIVAIDQARRSVTIDLGHDPTLDSGGYLFADRETVAYEAPTKRQIETDELRTSPVGVTVVDPESGENHRLGDEETRTIGPDSLVVVRTPVLLLVRPETTGTVSRDTETVIDLNETATVTLGFRSKADFPEETMQVHESPAGVARAISAASSAISVTTPDRTWPNVRDHPPRIEFVDDPAADTTAEIERPETDVELVVPETDALDYLFPTAPLAYYLGATVGVEAGVEPQLRAGSVTEQLGADPEAADQRASELLRRTFFLDCLARSAGPYGEQLAEHHLLTDAGLDADELYEASIAERARQYLDLSAADVERLDESLPTWHLGVHVRPVMDNVPSLSHHLARLSDIYRPEGATLETVKEQFDWAQERMTRGPKPQAEGDEVWVSPEERAVTVGWQGPRRALAAFNLDDVPERRPREESELSITVALAARDMVGESVVEQYGERDLPLEVEYVHGVKADDLADILESDRDLVHVIGHHEKGRGIECRHDFLSARQLSSCGAETFFLNACGSIAFGERLVELGATAGAVTTRAVTNESAAAVGMNWARLIALGWSVERALDFARSVDDPTGYVSVGDGAHAVTQSDAGVPAEISVTRESSDSFIVEMGQNGPRKQGGVTTDVLTETNHLPKDGRNYSVTESELGELASKRQSPVRHGGRIYWSTENLLKDL
jgi:hypothetical protein